MMAKSDLVRCDASRTGLAAGTVVEFIFARADCAAKVENAIRHAGRARKQLKSRAGKLLTDEKQSK
jgi:hypothetical protein